MKEKLKLYQIDNQILNDAIDRIVVKVHGMSKNGDKSFLFTGAGANGGTTTVALNVAISLAEAGWKAVFVDCDFRKEQKYKRIGTDVKSTLSMYLSGKTSNFDSIIQNTTCEKLDYIVAGDKNEKPVRLLCNANMENLIDRLKDRYDYIVIDTPSISVARDAEILLPYVDKYLFVSCMNMTTKKELFDARIGLSAYEDKFAGIIINKLDMMQFKSVMKDYDYFSDQNLAIKQKIGMDKMDNKGKKGKK